jgi:hypothetical protein
MWRLQVKGLSPETIKDFFTEWMLSSHFMPQFADLTEWLEARSVVREYDRATAIFRSKCRERSEKVEAWRNSADYEADLKAIEERARELSAKAAQKCKPRPVAEIPLAFNPEQEKEILAQYVKQREAQ